MKDYKYWNVHKINKTDDDKLTVSVELRDNDYDALQVNFKWDGCVNIWKHHNGYTNEDNSQEAQNNTDYIHICDLKEFINQLQEVLIIAKDILGEEKYKRDFE
jgi:hypothetical protein